jgi:hypothetical protein
VDKFSHGVIALHSSIPHRNARWPAKLNRIKHNHPNDGCLKMSAKVGLLVQDDTQERFVDLKSAIVVLNEAEFPEFVHEKIHP